MRRKKEYKPLADFPSYYAGSDGRIYRCPKKSVNGKKSFKCLTEFRYPNSKYLTVYIYRDRQKYGILVHRLVASAFLGIVPVDFDISHINGNLADNRPSNLSAEKTVTDPSAEKAVYIPSQRREPQGNPPPPALTNHGEMASCDSRDCGREIIMKYVMKKNTDEGLEVVVGRLETILKRHIGYSYSSMLWKAYSEIRSRGSSRLAYNWLNLQLRSLGLI